VMVQPDPAGADLPGHFVLAIHTRQRQWHLAVDSAHERSEWIRVLCEGGSQLSASSVQLPDADPLHGAAAAALRDAENTSASDAPPADHAVSGLDGVLWKRASKVHIAQMSETETGQARGWVSRHFRLLPAEGVVIYLQNSDDDGSAARGVVPLSSYQRVEDAQPPEEQLHAFQLVPATSSAVDSPSASPAGARGPEPLVLAASTAAEKVAWMERLGGALAAAAGGDAPRASGAASTLETQLAAASISG